MMLIRTSCSCIEFFSGITIKVQNIFSPYAHIIPFFHQFSCIIQAVIFHIWGCHSCRIFLHNAPEICKDTNACAVKCCIIFLCTDISSKDTTCLVLSCNIPRNNVFFVIFYIFEVSGQIFKGFHFSICQTCLFCPVSTIEHTMVCILSIMIFRHEINLVVVFTDIPVTVCTYLFPGLWCIGFQHIFRQWKECTFLCIFPSEQPVGCCTDQIQAAVAT